MNRVIKVENIGKKYIISHQEQGKSDDLRDSILRNTKNIGRRFVNLLKTKQVIGYNYEEFWALKDISFDVNKGERIGIIGRNGAGKTTILKILSRITEPTEGQITIKGRLASLLEVGTGFHPELTGRENIYLNGAILGMSRAEMKNKFDEIVEFAETEKFLDTPVKRYSSGMYVRLAFAIAAHLEPEILIVDEVLAVGDIKFQQKCLGKMKDVSDHDGRTVLFVSHNMATVEVLCPKSILLDNGHIIDMGETKRIIQKYLNISKKLVKLPLTDRTDRKGNGFFKVVGLTFGIINNEDCGYWQTGKDCTISFKYEADLSKLNNIDIGLSLYDLQGKRMFSVNTYVKKRKIELISAKGNINLKINKLSVSPGQYYISYHSYNNDIEVDGIENASKVLIEDGDFYGTGLLWGGYSTMFVEYEWNSK